MVRRMEIDDGERESHAAVGDDGAKEKYSCGSLE